MKKRIWKAITLILITLFILPAIFISLIVWIINGRLIPFEYFEWLESK